MSGDMRHGRLHRAYTAQPVRLTRHDVRPTDPAALDFLASAEFGEGWLHPAASNYTFVVELACGEQCGYGIYKPRAGETPLWDFPNGTLYQREVAAYELSRMLGWAFVPPTVVRDGALGVGSLQLYVPPQDDSNYFTLRDANMATFVRMAVFDIIANNADRKGGHCFAAESGGVWGVDHGLTFNEQHKLRTVIWDFAGQPVPEGDLADLRRLTAVLETMASEARSGLGAALDTTVSRARASLGALIAPREMDMLLRRVQAVLANPVLPPPYSRRDVPWPWL